MVNYWHVRISAKPQPMKDFLYFLNDIPLTREAQWDSDTTNHIKQHDYPSFCRKGKTAYCLNIWYTAITYLSQNRSKSV